MQLEQTNKINGLSLDILHDAPTEALKQELGRVLEVTADALLYMSKIWVELERRGEDLSQLRSGIRVFMPLIAEGRLCAQAVVQFSGNLALLRALALMPIGEQRRISQGKKIEVAMLDGSVKSIQADDLSSREIARVFKRGRIMPTSEQFEVINASSERQSALQTPSSSSISEKEEVVRITLRLKERTKAAIAILAEKSGETITEFMIRKSLE